jgi:ribosome-associated protein
LDIFVKGDHITLGQLLKVAGEIESGGQVKNYLDEETPLVNGQPEKRRGRKLRPGDVVMLQRVGEIRLLEESAAG